MKITARDIIKLADNLTEFHRFTVDGVRNAAGNNQKIFTIENLQPPTAGKIVVVDQVFASLDYAGAAPPIACLNLNCWNGTPDRVTPLEVDNQAPDYSQAIYFGVNQETGTFIISPAEMPPYQYAKLGQTLQVNLKSDVSTTYAGPISFQYRVRYLDALT